MKLQTMISACPGWLVIAVLALAVLNGESRGQCQYEITAIIQASQDCRPSSTPTLPSRLNKHGQACGYYRPCASGNDRAWVWYGPGDFRTLMPPGAVASHANDIADDGTVVGYFEPAAGYFRGFIYHPATGQYEILTPVLPNSSGECFVNAINALGVVAGERSLGVAGSPAAAFSYFEGLYVDLGVINGPRSAALGLNDATTIVGWTGSATHAENCRGFVIDEATTVLPPIPGGYSSVAGDINNRELIVGYGREFIGPFESRWRAFKATNGQMVSLGALPNARDSFANALNEANEIVGGSYTYPSELPQAPHPTVWRGGQMLDLRDWIMPHPGIIRIEVARSINDSGQVLLWAANAVGRIVTVVATPITNSPADLDHDCRVNVADLLLIIGTWGLGESWSDITGDDQVSVEDLLVVLREWGS